MIPFVKVVHTLSSIESDITPYLLSLQISKGTEATKNTLNIEFSNPKGSDMREQEFTINDSTFSVYLDWTPITSQDPVFVGTLSTEAEPMDNNGKYKFKLKCTDKTAMLLNKVWAESIQESEGWSVSLPGQSIDSEGNASSHLAVINNLIGHANNLDGGDINHMTTNNVATTKINGDAFPTNITISKIWKPFYEWINELSQVEYTGEDRPYVYWVDADNDLHWHYPYQKSQVILTADANIGDTTINVTSTATYPTTGFINIEQEVISYTGKTATSFTGCTRGAKMTNASLHLDGTIVTGLILYPGKQDIYSLNIETTEDQTYNFIIYNGGPTPAGYEYLDYSLDESQVGKKFRMKFVDWKGEGKDMQSKEAARTTITNGYPASYPYTPFWTTVAVSTDEQYQASFETELRRRCENKAQAYYAVGKQKFRFTCQMRYSDEYNVNDLVTVTSPEFDRIIYARIKDIKIQLTKGGCIMDIEGEEDPSALTLDTNA